jgi:tRNA uridine 5-carbamoylmethylation protein Kti12
MLKLILMKGLPGSGKTTWAKLYQKDHPNTKRVNRDELRAMLDDGVWSRENEEFVVEQEQFLVTMAWMNEYDVIVDDTNLAPKTLAMWEEHAENQKHVTCACGKERGVEIIVQDFTNVPLDVCLKRDAGRHGKQKVGAEVIKRFYNDYVKPKETV